MYFEFNKHGLRHEKSEKGKILRLRRSWIGQLHQYISRCNDIDAQVSRKWATENVDKICAQTSAEFYFHEFASNILGALREILLWNTDEHWPDSY